MWEIVTPAAVGLLTAVLGWFGGRYREREQRREKFILDRVEEILRVIVRNAETAHLADDDPERASALRDTKEALALIPIYGSARVRAVREQQPEDALALVAALQEQGRQLLGGRDEGLPRWRKRL